MNSLSFTLAQINPTLGDLAGNAARVLDVWRDAGKDHKSDLVVFPELVLSGYPPEDLILRDGFLSACKDALLKLAADGAAFEAAALVGCPWVIEGKVYNAVHLLHGGEILATRCKHHLPNYGVFDEQRVFDAAPLPDIVAFKGVKLGIMICEDMWHADVAAHLAAQGAEMLVVSNASPWRIGKEEVREAHAKARTRETALPLLYVNQIGGQDALVFDGGSFVMDAEGAVVARAKAFEEDALAYCHSDQAQRVEESGAMSRSLDYARDDNEGVWNALTLGIRDYVRKNGFSDVLIGLSGGIDSALTAALAVDALGAAHVRCVMLPSPFTSEESLEDAKACAEMLGVSYEVLPIAGAMDAFAGIIPDLAGLAHENMQSRIRGSILMALSNQSGALLLTTGNKSEMAVGYATLYGDMNGAFNALKDVYKTRVYALSRWRNARGAVMPERIITKAPSAELRADQTDQDSLPDYDVLDAILEGLVEGQQSVDGIVADGFEREIVEHVAHLLRISEYKRNQAPPGVKITTRAFDRDWRYPMTNKYGFH
ncbi:MAG: NAD+ synthase [Alphaproteobacteria bacterium]